MHRTVSLAGEVASVFSLRAVYRRASHSPIARSFERDGALSAARGIVIAVVLGVILWAGIIWTAISVFDRLR